MPENIVNVFERMRKKYGIFQTIQFGFNVIFQFIFLSKFYKNQNFVFNGKKYQYCLNFLNGTHTNERIIEIPIISEILKETKCKNILEIGNVISKYHSFPHTIVDKYEKDENVINQDVIEYHSDEKFGMIFSISTMEHVGYDEIPRNPKKILLAFENLKSLLKQEGKIIVTMPLGYNKYLDEYLEKGMFGFQEQFFFKKNHRFNTWKQVKKIDFSKAKYESNFPPHASSLILAIFTNNN